MRITNALSSYDAYARTAPSYPLGETRVQAVEALAGRYAEPRHREAQLPVERVIEGEIIRESNKTGAGYDALGAQRFYTVHAEVVTPTANASESAPHPAIAVYQQHAQTGVSVALGGLLDHYV